MKKVNGEKGDSVTNEQILKQWINPSYLDEKRIQRLKKKFIKNKPFPYLGLDNFFKQEKAISLLRTLMREKFYIGKSHWFKLMSTGVFSPSNKVLKDFKPLFCSKEFARYLEQLTGLNLKVGEIESGSLYSNTDYLICHLDELENGRLAVLLYLSDLKKKDGGALALSTAKKVVKRITPRFNKFALFKETSKSFHAIEEVVTNKQRITIGGTFYGPTHK